MYTMCMPCLLRPEGGVRFLGTRVDTLVNSIVGAGA